MFVFWMVSVGGKEERSEEKGREVVVADDERSSRERS